METLLRTCAAVLQTLARKLLLAVMGKGKGRYLWTYLRTLSWKSTGGGGQICRLLVETKPWFAESTVDKRRCVRTTLRTMLWKHAGVCGPSSGHPVEIQRSLRTNMQTVFSGVCGQCSGKTAACVDTPADMSWKQSGVCGQTCRQCCGTNSGVCGQYCGKVALVSAENISCGHDISYICPTKGVEKGVFVKKGAKSTSNYHNTGCVSTVMSVHVSAPWAVCPQQFSAAQVVFPQQFPHIFPQHKSFFHNIVRRYFRNIGSFSARVFRNAGRFPQQFPHSFPQHKSFFHNIVRRCFRNIGSFSTTLFRNTGGFSATVSADVSAPRVLFPQQFSASRVVFPQQIPQTFPQQRLFIHNGFRNTCCLSTNLFPQTVVHKLFRNCFCGNFSPQTFFPKPFRNFFRTLFPQTVTNPFPQTFPQFFRTLFSTNLFPQAFPHTFFHKPFSTSFSAHFFPQTFFHKLFRTLLSTNLFPQTFFPQTFPQVCSVSDIDKCFSRKML